MFGFLKKKEYETKTYDTQNEKPVIKASICNGEQVAGFKNISNGSFREVMLIQNSEDLKYFKEQYGITTDIEKIY